MTLLARFWDWVDQRAITRRIVLGVTVWMTWRAFAWAAVFAETTTRVGTDTGLIIAAVTAPIAALQAAAFKVYSEGRAE